MNIGALLGLAPITGVPLPFLSYGGSSFIVSSIAIGMVLFALKYDQDYKENLLIKMRMGEFVLEEEIVGKEEQQNQDFTDQEIVNETFKEEEEEEDEHEEITGG